MSSPCASTQASASCEAVHPFPRHFLDAPHQVEIQREILSLKTRRIATIVIRRQIFQLENVR